MGLFDTTSPKPEIAQRGYLDDIPDQTRERALELAIEHDRGVHDAEWVVTAARTFESFLRPTDEPGKDVK